MLGLLPNTSLARSIYKHTLRNLLPMQTSLRVEMELRLPGLVLAPTNEGLISVIGTLEGHLAEAEQ